MIKVLIFEDNQTFSKELVDACTKLSQKAFPVTTLEQAQETLKCENFDIAIIDLMIPNSTKGLEAQGVRVMSYIDQHNSKNNKNIKKLLVSGSSIFNGSYSDQHRCKMVGADFFMRKPVSAIEVALFIETLAADGQLNN